MIKPRFTPISIFFLFSCRLFYEKEWNYIWNCIEYTFLALKQEIVWGCAEILPLFVFSLVGGNCYNINFKYML